GEVRNAETPSIRGLELSTSTRSKDMVKKLNTYMLSGVGEFWVVDPKQKTIIIHVFKDLQIDGFHIYKNDEAAVSLAFEGLVASLTEVFL
ncbi:MAG: Uma2 family endonuclease, partial [Eubacteriales bacterium]|nr:Uma2 family endonuclease [Eubacteriales bacterium]